MNMNNLGKKIKEIIINDEKLSKFQTFNLINDEKAKSPFIVVRINSINHNYDKNNLIYPTATFTILVVSVKYDDVINIASDIVSLFDHQEFDWGDKKIEDIRIINISEDFDIEMYITEIQFSAIINLENN